jgi:hypothetical protein
MVEKRKSKTGRTMNKNAAKAAGYFSNLRKSVSFSKPQLVIFAAVFALVGFLIYKSIAADVLVATLEAEQMSLPADASVITDSSASGGKAIKMLSSGAATGSVSFASSVTSFNVQARGDQCSGAPAMTVALDGANLLTNASVSATAWSTYTATPANAINAGTHTLSISFTNDYYYAGKAHGKSGKTNGACDRNLYVDVTNFFGPSAVTPPPTVSLSASPASVTAGQAATLTWASTNASSCTASDAWSGSQPTSGSVSTGALNQTSTYALTCTGDGGSAQASTTVTVSGGGTTGAIPGHIETWAYDGTGGGGYNQATNTAASLIRQWVTYAEGDMSNGKAATDCHGGTPACKALAYLDTNLIYTVASCGSTCSVPIWNDAQENWWLHQPGYTDSAHRLTYPSGSHIAYRLNHNVPAVVSWFKNYLDAHGNSFDGMFMDDTAADLAATVYNSGFSSSQEVTSDSQVQAGHQQMSAGLTHSDGTPFIQINNGVQAQTYLNSMPSLQLTTSSKNVIGLISEDSSVNHATMLNQLYYGTLVDLMGYVGHTNYSLVLLGEASNGDPHWRRVQQGTVLLGYLPGRIIDWANLETASSNLAVWPEQGIYPTQPVQTMNTPSGSGCLTGSGSLCASGGHNDIQVAPGVYRREFGACYNQGKLFGRCAVIVNSTTSAVTVQSGWLTQSYGHQITFNGGDVQSGGSLNLAGAGFAAGSTSVPAQDSMELSQ